MNYMQGNNRIGRRIGLVPAYTALWAVCAGILWTVFHVCGKSFLWTIDGVPQHFVAFNYLCGYVEDLFLNHWFRGFFNYSLGQGMDILQTLNSYDFTDPVSAVAALFFPLSRVQRYTLMIFLKHYLVGLSFLLYCRATERTERMAVLSGTIAYTFSGAVLYFLSKFPNYINWAYFFPFLLSGAELYIRRRKRVPLVLFVALNVITSYYTFYMNTVLLAVYLLNRSVCRYSENRTADVLKKECGTLFRTLLVCAVGVALSAMFLLPSIDAFLNNYRVGVASGYGESLLHYEWPYYLKLPETLFAMNHFAGYETALGLNAASFFPLVLLFLRRGQNRESKSLLVISLLMLCVPFAGRVVNGFGYPINRWAYAVPFYVSVILTDLCGDLPEMTLPEKRACEILLAVYLAFCMATSFLHRNLQTRNVVFSALALLLAVSVLLLLRIRYGKRSGWNRAFLGMVVLCSLLQILLDDVPAVGGQVNEYLDRAETESFFWDYSSVAVKDDSCGFFRVEEEDQEIIDRQNHDSFHNINGTSFYWSMYPVWVYDYYRELGLSSVSQNCRPAGLSGRTGLLELAGVKYYTRPASDFGGVPYGYREIPSQDPRYQIYENPLALPVGYTCSSWMPREEYDALDGIEKEQALLQTAVLEHVPELTGLERAIPEQAAESLKVEVRGTTGVQLTENHISAQKGGAVTLSVDVPRDCELYLYLRNIRLEDKPDPFERYIFDKYCIKLAASRITDRFVTEKTAWISNRSYQWPVLRDDLAFNLGCGPEGETSIQLTFGRKSEYAIGEIEVIAVPMSAYEKYAQKLGEYVLENAVVGADSVSGTITVPDTRILQFSIPYSSGWNAYLDGERTELLRSDVMYMSVIIPEGEHQVELHYKTPGLKTGLIISVVVLIAWGAFEYSDFRRRRRINFSQNMKNKCDSDI